MKTYPIDEYVSNLVAQWKKSSNNGEPSEEAINAKVTEVGNKLAEDIDGRFGPCNLIEFDATSKRLIIDHTEQAHRKIEAFLKESIPVSATQSVSGPVDDSVIVARPEFDQPQGIEAAKRFEQQAQEIANLPRFYLYANNVSAWLDGMSDEADRSVANFEKAMSEHLKPDTPSSTRITAWDEKRFLFGYDKPNLDGARGNTRIVNHYFSHENSFWQRQKTNKDAPQYSKLELPYVWKQVDANAFFHLRSARLEFPWGNTDGNIKFAIVPLEFAEYQAVGEETVDGAKCWVVMSKPRRCKLWFDQKSGRLLQMLRYVMQGVEESTPFHETPEVEKLCGRKFETLDAFHEFGKATDRATFQRLAGLYGSLYFDDFAHPIELTRFSDYREIAPGIWFPMKQPTFSRDDHPQIPISSDSRVESYASSPWKPLVRLRKRLPRLFLRCPNRSAPFVANAAKWRSPSQPHTDSNRFHRLATVATSDGGTPLMWPRSALSPIQILAIRLHPKLILDRIKPSSHNSDDRRKPVDRTDRSASRVELHWQCSLASFG